MKCTVILLRGQREEYTNEDTSIPPYIFIVCRTNITLGRNNLKKQYHESIRVTHRILATGQADSVWVARNRQLGICVTNRKFWEYTDSVSAGVYTVGNGRCVES